MMPHFPLDFSILMKFLASLGMHDLFTERLAIFMRLKVLPLKIFWVLLLFSMKRFEWMHQIEYKSFYSAD